MKRFTYILKSSMKHFVRSIRVRLGLPKSAFLDAVFENLGYFESVRADRPISCTGEPIPWLTYGAIAFLDGIDMSNFKILEFGGGGSSFFWEAKGAMVEIHEDNPKWVEFLENRISERSYLVTHSPTTPNYGCEFNGFDVVLIDGLKRVQVMSEMISAIHIDKSSSSPDFPGILIVDNSDWYPKAVESLEKACGYSRIDFKGIGPANNYEWTTSIFINPNKIFRSVSSNSRLASNSTRLNNTSVSRDDRELDDIF